MAVSFILIALMLAAAAYDVTRYTIPNWVCGAVALAFPVAALIAGFGWMQIGLHAATGLAALLFGMALFAPGLVGGGDAKLFAAAALWFGWPGSGLFLLATVIAGGVLTLILLAARRFAPASASGWMAEGPLAPGKPVPYGIALAAGAMWALPHSVWLTGL